MRHGTHSTEAEKDGHNMNNYYNVVQQPTTENRNQDVEQWRSRELIKNVVSNAQQSTQNNDVEKAKLTSLINELYEMGDVSYYPELETYYRWSAQGKPLVFEGTTTTKRAPAGSNVYWSSMTPAGAGWFKLSDAGRVTRTTIPEQDPWIEWERTHSKPIPEIQRLFYQTVEYRDNAQRRATAIEQAFLKQEMLESPTAQWGSAGTYRDTFTGYFGIAPSPDTFNRVLIPTTQEQLYEKTRMLRSPSAQWGDPSYYVQEVDKLNRRGYASGIDTNNMTWYGVEGSPGYQWSASDNQARLDEINRYHQLPDIPGISSDIPQWLKEYKTGMEYPNTPIGAKYQEHAYKSASDYWEGLSTPQKAVALTYHGLRDFGVAGSFIQSRFAKGERGYINKVFEKAPKGQKSFKNGAGFVWEGMKGDASQMAVTGFGLGVGLKALKLSPTILKGIGYGATGYQGYTAVKDIESGEYGKAITESAVFVGSVPFIAAGYGTKIPIEKMFGSSLRKAQIKSFGGERYYVEPELKPIGKPFLEKALGIKTKPETAPITNVKQKMFGYSGYEKPTRITPLDILLFDPRDPRWAKALKVGSLSAKEKMNYIRSERTSQQLSEKAEFERIRQEKMMFERSPHKTEFATSQQPKIKTTSDAEFYARQKAFANTLREQNMFKELHRMAPEPQLERLEPPRRTKLVMERGVLKSIPVWKTVEAIPIERSRPDIYDEGIHKSIVLNINKLNVFSKSRFANVPKPVKKVRTFKTLKPTEQIRIKAPPRNEISIKSVQTIKPNLRIGYVPSFKVGNIQASKPTFSQKFEHAQAQKSAQKQLQRQSFDVALLQKVKTVTQTRKTVPTKLRISQKSFQTPTQKIIRTPKIQKPPVIKTPILRIPKSSKNTGVFRSKRGRNTFGKFREIAKVASVRQILGRKIKI